MESVNATYLSDLWELPFVQTSQIDNEMLKLMDKSSLLYLCIGLLCLKLLAVLIFNCKHMYTNNKVGMKPILNRYVTLLCVFFFLLSYISDILFYCYFR